MSAPRFTILAWLIVAGSIAAGLGFGKWLGQFMAVQPGFNELAKSLALLFGTQIGIGAAACACIARRFGIGWFRNMRGVGEYNWPGMLIAGLVLAGLGLWEPTRVAAMGGFIWGLFFWCVAALADIGFAASSPTRVSRLCWLGNIVPLMFGFVVAILLFSLSGDR